MPLRTSCLHKMKNWNGIDRLPRKEHWNRLDMKL
jgi:hypothetical protein